jgi:hypothetical protein
MTEKSPLFNKLRDSAALLAASSDEQIDALRAMGTNCDELALDYDAFAKAAPNLVEAGEITEATLEQVEMLLHTLDQLSDDKSQWDVSVLPTSPQWQHVRHAARAVVDALDGK